ncbi:formate dehydrogenase [Sphaeroforma arctica JP610]|uniref:Formate dehydrogenase n=1 Tax=Sphaeroforma arctica JP610 TaxID=667725 RepID=A0A0L0G4J0_9EUKA|nr:formate dehydrogenase [Sphaeroforma arctica JP610]KNC84002.1 formate dehydrogenase [Sphaeroforma arctica JP610]|eukprot:XP_014157904.1 formate dehydrogenase [Sphaeroforma arctica JP610]
MFRANNITSSGRRSVRYFSSAHRQQAKVVCALYPDPAVYPPKYARDSVPNVGLDTCPSDPWARPELTPGQLLGSVSGELGLRSWLEARGHTLVVTSDKDGPGCEFERELKDADIAISQPFWPAYITKERMEQSPNLKMCITAGIGSDHVDLEAANDRKIAVTEVTGSNVVSVAEHVVMMILGLVRNYIPSNKIATSGGWDIGECASRAYDLEGMNVGTVAAGRIGLRVMRRLHPFDVKLHYYDHHRLPEAIEKELNVTYHPTVESLVETVDVVTINCPLHPETENLFDEKLIGKMKKGAYIVNTARGKICDKNAIKAALESGQLAGYAGDVWFPQPAPADHPWRNMPHAGMTPHYSGTTLSAQARYVAGVFEILENYFEGKEQRHEYLICQDGKLAGAGKHSYTSGNTTDGSYAAASA